MEFTYCATNARCINLPGTYDCTCVDGYVKQNDGDEYVPNMGCGELIWSCFWLDLMFCFKTRISFIDHFIFFSAIDLALLEEKSIKRYMTILLGCVVLLYYML